MTNPTHTKASCGVATPQTNPVCCVCGEKETHPVEMTLHESEWGQSIVVETYTKYYCSIYCQKESYYDQHLDGLIQKQKKYKMANSEMVKKDLRECDILKKLFTITMVMNYCIEALIKKEYKKAYTMMEKKKTQVMECLDDIKEENGKVYMGMLDEFLPLIDLCETFMLF
jgi:hypothetical protein